MYAKDTKVSAQKSRQEIERTLERYGATGFMYGWEGASAMLAFAMSERRVKFILPLPEVNDFAVTPQGQQRNPSAMETAHAQAIRQRWRALALVIKAKLEAVETGIVTFEDEFLSHIMMPDGSTVGDAVRPKIALAYETGEMQRLLPSYHGEH